MSTRYAINKGINQSLAFKGLKAQYIWYLGGVILADLVLFAILYISGVNPYLSIAIALGLGAVLVSWVYRMSNRYGEFGLLKKAGRKLVPKAIRSFSRKGFIQLKK